MNTKFFFLFALGLLPILSWAISFEEAQRLPKCSSLPAPHLSHRFFYKNKATFPHRGKLDYFEGIQNLRCLLPEAKGADADLSKLLQKLLGLYTQGEYVFISNTPGKSTANIAQNGLAQSPASQALAQAFRFQGKQTVLDEDEDITLEMFFNVFGLAQADQLAFSVLSLDVQGEGDNENLLKKDDHILVEKVEDHGRLYVLQLKRVIYIIKPSSYALIPISENMFLNGAMGASGAKDALEEDFKGSLNFYLSAFRKL